MKILTREEEQEHYNATVIGGAVGGAAGATLGAAGVYAASTRYPAFRSLTLPFRVFLIASTGTFSAIVSADSYSRRFEQSRHGAGGGGWGEQNSAYEDRQRRESAEAERGRSALDRARSWAGENKYGIVFGSWVLSMGTALGLVGRNPYLTGAQKLVQARVYAQGLTIAVVVASLALEGSDASQGRGRWQTVKVLDPDDPTHKHLIEKKVHKERYSGEDQWMDMVAAEEERIKERDAAVKDHEARDVQDRSKTTTMRHGGESEKRDTQSRN